MKNIKKIIKTTLSMLLTFSVVAALAACGDDSGSGATSDPTDAPTAEPVIAGTDSGIVRDGTPKKYFTISFDDGITQDLRVIEILKKYNMDCCTFNINTGLLGESWDWVGQQLGNPSLTHIRFTEEELRTGIYDGFDVEVHGLTHASLKLFDNEPEKIVEEIGKDAENIQNITGIKPVGMAWAGGDTEWTDTTVSLVVENTDIRFGRAAASSYNFELPEYFMKWYPTCSISDPQLNALARKFVNAECEEDMLFYVWCHSYELEYTNSYDAFESFIKYMSKAEDVVFVTNAEFYQLFKDEIPSWK